MIIAILAAIGGTIATLSGPDRLQEVTDAIAEGLTGEIDIEHIRNVIIILGGIYLSGALLNLVQTQIMAYVTQMVSKQLRSDISRKINRLPMAYFGKTTTGDVLSRVTNDVDTLGQSLNQSVGTLVSAVTLFFGSIIMMLRNNVKMTGAAVGATIIGFVLMSLIMSRSQKYFRSQQKRLGEVNGRIIIF